MKIASNEIVSHTMIADVGTRIAAEIVDAEIVEKLEPIHLSASLQIIISPEAKTIYRVQESLEGIQSTLIAHTEQLSDICHRVVSDIDSISSIEILYDIRDKLNKRINLQAVEVSFMKVSDMAQNLSVSKSFLEKNMDGIFIEGLHFSRANDARLVRWDIEQMHKWAKGAEDAEKDSELLSKLLD